MIQKKFLLICGIALICLFVVLYQVKVNQLIAGIERTFDYESNGLEGYTGKVRITKQNKVLYEGSLKDGVCFGKGILYDFEGNLIYEGMFEDNKFHGQGVLYYLDGSIQYEGDFAGNLFDGKGVYYLSINRTSNSDSNRVFNGTSNSASNMVSYSGTFKEGEFLGGYGETVDEEKNQRYVGELSGFLYEGKGKLYNINNELIYEGDFVQGLYEGIGRIYEPNTGKLYYSGGFFQGVYQGEGKEYDLNSGSVLYEGTFLSNQYEGSGKLYNPITKHLVYEGSFLEGKFFGEGILYDNNNQIEYKGEWKEGVYNGEGTVYIREEETGICTAFYRGSFVEGRYEGYGEYQDNLNQILYLGDFLKDKCHGKGVIYNLDRLELIYEGEFAEGLYEGSGILYDLETGALLYEGSFYKGLYEGEGRLYDPLRLSILYEGGFQKGKYFGTGRLYNPQTGLIEYEGTFQFGKKAGIGVFYDQYGRKLVEGSVMNGELDYVSFLGMPVDKVQAFFDQKLVKVHVNEEVEFFINEKSMQDIKAEAIESEIEDIEGEVEDIESDIEDIESEDEDKKGEIVDIEGETNDIGSETENAETEDVNGKDSEIANSLRGYNLYYHKSIKACFVENLQLYPEICAGVYIYDNTMPKGIITNIDMEVTDIKVTDLTEILGIPIMEVTINPDAIENFILSKIELSLDSIYKVTFDYQGIQLNFYYKDRLGDFLFYSYTDIDLY